MPGTTFSTSNWTGYDEQSVTNPSSALTDFTLLIDISTLSSTWKSNVQSDGGDIRLTKGDDTELPFDLIDWAYNAGAPTGFVRVKWSGTLAASGTQNVRVWAGYTGGTAVAYGDTETYGADNAYDANWEAYYPLHDLNDRTSHGNTLSANGTPTTTTGKLGTCYSFDSASSEYLAVTGATGVNLPITIMLWQKKAASVGSAAIASWSDAAGVNDGRDHAAVYSRFNEVITVKNRDFDISDTDVNGSTSLGDDVWGHLALTCTSTALEPFVNGVSDATPGTLSSHSITYDAFTIGARRWNTSSFDNYHTGEIDDVQFHSAQRHDDWIKEEFDQANNQATFWGTWAWTAAAGGGATVSPTAGSLTLTGASPSVALLINRTLTAGALTLTGEQPSVSRQFQKAPTAAALTLTGAAPVVAFNITRTPAAAALTIAGQQPGVLVETPGVTEVQPTAGTLTLTGESPAIALKIDRSPTAASLTLTGEQPSVAIESFKDVQPTAANLTLTGASPAIALKINVSPAVATLSITGSEIGVSVPGLGRTTSAGSSKRRRSQRGYPRRVVIDGVVYTVRSAEELRQLLAAQQERLEEKLEALEAREAPATQVRSVKRQITVVRKKIDATERDYMHAILDDDDEVITVWAMLQ